ncbi:hypothetical protein [Halobacillus halophilus]|uniref:hypothetical protein n=1 Tax=Halobacillus halophilus TaxID=1570 RepID=UPI0002D29FC3|nr:hypothetical protein [Halobacillus halophilus]
MKPLVCSSLSTSFFFLLNYIGQRFLSGKSKHQVNFTVLITVSLIETAVLFIFIATGWFFEV